MSIVFLFQNQFPKKEEVSYETVFETVDLKLQRSGTEGPEAEWPKFTSPF